MLQPPCRVRDLLLLPSIQNHYQAVHIQRDMTLDHSRACVETKDGEARVEEIRINQFDVTASLEVVIICVFKHPVLCELLPEINLS